MRKMKRFALLAFFIVIANAISGRVEAIGGDSTTFIINDDFESSKHSWTSPYQKDIQNNAVKLTANTCSESGGKQALSITSSGKHICMLRPLNSELKANDKIVFDFYLTGDAIPLNMILSMQDTENHDFVYNALYRNLQKDTWLKIEIPIEKFNHDNKYASTFLRSKIKNITVGATPIEEDRDKNLTFTIDNFRIIRSNQDSPASTAGNMEKAFIPAYKIDRKDFLKKDISQIGGIDAFMNVEGGLAKERTAVAVFYDDNNLYIRFKCYDKAPHNIVKKYKTHDDPVYLDDDLEIFIDPANGSNNYYQFLLNPIGTKAEAKGITDYLSKEYEVSRLDWKWDANWTSDIEIKKDSWEGVISIPMNAIGLSIPTEGKINICRSYRGREEASSLFVRRIDWHNPKEWGNIVFMKKETPLEYFKLEHIGTPENLNFSFAVKTKSKMDMEIGFLYSKTNIKSKNTYQVSVSADGNFSLPYSLEEKKSELIFSLKKDNEPVFRNVIPLLFTKDGFTHNVQVVHEDNNCSIWIENPSSKILPQDKVNKLSSSKEVNVSLAKNEYEPFQLVITPAADMLNKEISFEISDLSGEGDNAGKIIPRANITFNPELYLNIKAASSSRPDSFPGKWPDPLSLEQSFKLTSMQHQPFWFTIYSDKNTKAGIYRGIVKIMADGKAFAEFQLKVKIWDFTLPDISCMRTVAIYDQAEKCNISNREFLKTIKSHKMSPGRIYDSADFETIYGYNSDFTMLFSPSLFGVGSWDMKRKMMFNVNGQEKDIYSDEFKKYWISLIREKCKALKEKNILNKFYFWIWDEPWYTADPSLMEKVVYLSKMIKEAEPDLKIVTGGNERMGDKALSGLIDAWITDLYIGGGCYEYEMAKRLKAKGQETWAYHNELYLINVEGIYPRLLSYILLKYDIDCYVFWHISKWCDWKTGKYYPDLYQEAENNSLRCGDGLLLYYDKDKKRIVNSLRWELLRDSFEDYDYYVILKQKLAEAIKNKKLSEDKIKAANELIEYPDKLIKTYRSLNHITQDDIYRKRNEIGEFIDNNLR